MDKNKDLAADVIVIGSGAGGGFIATALAESGKSVLLLERGGWFDYQKDFPARHPDWELRQSAFSLDTLSRDPTIDFRPGAPIAEQDYDICSRFNIDSMQNPERRGRFQYSRVWGVGGSTLHYQGEAHRFPAHAFNMKDRYGFGNNWPLSYEALAPYYAKAEKWLGVAGDSNNPFKPVRGPYPLPAHDLSTKSQWVKRACDGLGWKLLPNSLALPSRSFQGRSPCRHSGMCVRGCPFGAKSSVDRAVLPRGLKTGRLKILENTRVLELKTSADGEISGVVCLREGRQQLFHAERYVLAAGGIETPRLMLSSQSDYHPDGVGNRYDRVGRSLMETVFSVLTVKADRPLQSWKGQPIDSRIWDFNTPDQWNSRNGFVLGVSSSLGPYSGPTSYARAIPGSGMPHKDAMRENFGRIVDIFGIADHSPDSNNRLQLSNRKDEAGMPKVIISSDYYARDRATLRQMINKMFILAKSANPEKILHLGSSYDNPLITHIAGTCMMGDDREQSVVDENGRVYGIKNLYIADASVLPGQGMGDSPSLTIQALALRTADMMQ